MEIVSPGSTRLDGVRKRALYEAQGVREYWLVLPELDQVEVLVAKAEGGFLPPRLLDRDGVLASVLLPGFGLPLAQLFRAEPRRPAR